MAEKNLKNFQYYADLYDAYTVEKCRRTEQLFNKPSKPVPEDSKLTKREKEGIERLARELMLHYEIGERYINRERQIREWMEADKKKDDLYESAQAPEDIRCLTCRNKLKPTFKELWSDSEKGDRVLFMYDCPNKCLPRRAFFSDGEEWRVKPTLCTQCNTPVKTETNDTGKKLITTDICSSCGYVETDEYEWSHKKDKDDFDPDFAKDRNRFCLSDEEGKKYQQEKWQLENLARISKEWEEEKKRREEKLEENPKGFHLDGVGYTCFICGQNTCEKEDNWYDQYGIKCLICQKAIYEGEIPATLASDKDSWYSKYDLKSCFNLTTQALRKWVKEGIIKSRIVSHYGNGTHTELFLIEDNKDFLPPKDMVKSQWIKNKIDGKEYQHPEPWYKFVDPFEHLKGYKIMDHMRLVPPEEVKAKEEEKKKKAEEKRIRREQKKANQPKI